MQIPTIASEVTLEWINNVMLDHLGGATITQCAARDSDIPGQTAEIIMLDLEFDQPTDVGRRLVMKIKSRNPVVLEHIIPAYDLYHRETSFYAQFPDPGLPIPKIYLSVHDPATQDFCILMEDLAPSHSPSWAITPDEVEMSLAALPAFHAKWWNDPAVRGKDYCVQFDNVDFFAALFDGAAAAKPVVETHCGDSAELVVRCMTLIADNKDKILSYMHARTFTLVHGDYHAKQMFFPTAEGGRFAVIDWQFPFVAPGPWDFARMLGVCMDENERKQREARLSEHYLSGLRAEGVTYSDQDFRDDCRFGLAISQMIMCVAIADTDVELIAKECGDLGVDWKDALLYRTQSMMADWDTEDLLNSIVG